MNQYLDIVRLKHSKDLILNRVLHTVDSITKDFVSLDHSHRKELITKHSSSSWDLLFGSSYEKDVEKIIELVKLVSKSYKPLILDTQMMKSSGCVFLIQLSNMATEFLGSLASEEYWKMIDKSIKQKSDISLSSFLYKITTAILLLHIQSEIQGNAYQESHFNPIEDQKINFASIGGYILLSIILILILALVKSA